MASWTEQTAPAPLFGRSGRPVTLLVIGLGGAAGTFIRSTLETAFPAGAGTWPWATFGINISGAFILTLLLESLAILGQDDGWRRRVRLGVGTGVLGGYTTYSTFMVEAARLGQSGAYGVALLYVGVSLVLGVAAAWAAMSLVSALRRRAMGAHE